MIERETIAVALPHRATAEQSAWLNSRPLHSVTFAMAARNDGYQLLEFMAATFATSPDMFAASTHTLEVCAPTLTPLCQTTAKISALIWSSPKLEVEPSRRSSLAWVISDSAPSMDEKASTFVSLCLASLPITQARVASRGPCPACTSSMCVTAH